jgi:hypothetical protein
MAELPILAAPSKMKKNVHAIVAAFIDDFVGGETQHLQFLQLFRPFILWQEIERAQNALLEHTLKNYLMKIDLNDSSLNHLGEGVQRFPVRY